MGYIKFCNRTGFPCLEVQSVTSDGTTTTFNFNSHPYMTNYFKGAFWVRIPMAVTTSTQPVQFATLNVSGSQVPVYDNGGTQTTVAEYVTTGDSYRLFFYNRETNKLQLVA